MRRFGLNMAISMAALLLAIMGVFAGISFGCFSLYLYFVTVISPPLAALATAFAALLFAVAVTGIAGLVWRRPQRPCGDNFAGYAEAISLGKMMGLEGRAFLTTHLSKTTMAVFGLGFAMGLSPKLRKLISDLLLR